MIGILQQSVRQRGIHDNISILGRRSDVAGSSLARGPCEAPEISRSLADVRFVRPYSFLLSQGTSPASMAHRTHLGWARLDFVINQCGVKSLTQAASTSFGLGLTHAGSAASRARDDPTTSRLGPIKSALSSPFRETCYSRNHDGASQHSFVHSGAWARLFLSMGVRLVAESSPLLQGVSWLLRDALRRQAQHEQLVGTRVLRLRTLCALAMHHARLTVGRRSHKTRGDQHTTRPHGNSGSANTTAPTRPSTPNDC